MSGTSIAPSLEISAFPCVGVPGVTVELPVIPSLQNVRRKEAVAHSLVARITEFPCGPHIVVRHKMRRQTKVLDSAADFGKITAICD